MKRGRPAGDTGDTRARILTAAAEEIAAHGIAGARTVTIAQRAGVTHAMLHYYFHSKDELHRSVLLSLGAECERTLVAAIQSAEAPLDLPGLVAALFDCLATNRLYVRTVLWEIAAGGGVLRSLPLPTLTAVDAGLLERLPPGVDVPQVLTTLLGATVVYFFDDPLLERLFGEDWFGPSALSARSRHLQKLTLAMLAPEP